MTKQSPTPSPAAVSPSGDAGAPNQLIAGVQAILREEINLAKPDDLAFLESQVPRIASRIVDLPGLGDGSQ